MSASCCPESAGAERERRGVRTGKGAATVWVEASKDVTWSAGCSLSSTQRQCHLKVDPPQLQHFLHSCGSGEEHPLVSRFYMLTPDFFSPQQSLSLPLSLTLSQHNHRVYILHIDIYILHLFFNFPRRQHSCFNNFRIKHFSSVLLHRIQLIQRKGSKRRCKPLLAKHDKGDPAHKVR